MWKLGSYCAFISAIAIISIAEGGLIKIVGQIFGLHTLSAGVAVIAAHMLIYIISVRMNQKNKVRICHVEHKGIERSEQKDQ